MSIAKKDMFCHKDIRYTLEGVSSKPFPPEKIKYEGIGLSLLGKSNKTDLHPVSIEDNGLHKAALHGEIGQFIYTTKHGDLFDVLVYVDETESVNIYSIKNRGL